MTSNKTYHEPARDIPVLAEYDVAVCGGGPAGCAAAIASARHGARTLLVEKEGALGGAPVTQNVVPILSTNGVDFQGIWHEWARALRNLNGITKISHQPMWGTTWLVGSVDPVLVPVAWDDLLTQAGADILHLCWAAGAIVEDGAIRGVIIEAKGGRKAVFAKRVIDCTGDADVCDAAGVDWEQGAAGAPWAMGVGLNAWYGGVRTAPDYVPGTANKFGATGRSLGNLPLFQAGLLRILKVDPLNPWDLTRALREGRERVWQRFYEKKKQPGEEQLFMAGVATNPGVRSSRRIRGRATATADDAWNLNKYHDGIARSSWEIDIHPPESLTGKAVDYNSPVYAKRIAGTDAGDWFDIRYGCIVANGVDNLLTAGRCISAEHEAQSSLRIQQTCMSTGQAAGVAAAMSLAENVTPAQLDAAKLINQLERDRDVEPAFEGLVKGK